MMTIDPIVELRYDNAWNNITSDVDIAKGEIGISRGRKGEAHSADPGSCSLSIDNRTGKYSPRNPNSVLFGKIGRNTPLRVRIGAKDVSLALPGSEKSYISTPDHASLDITGDIDIRLECAPATWRPKSMGLARKYVIEGTQRSWVLWLESNGTLRLRWSNDGTATTTVTSTAAIPDDDARRAVRITLDVNNGASGNDVKFFTATSIGGAWTQLGATVTTAGVTSIFSSTSDLEVGRTSGPADGLSGVATDEFDGRIYAFEMRNGIDGTVVANPVFTTPHAGDTSLTDGSGRTWTIFGGAAFVDESVRFAGEVASWPPRWDVTGKDVWVPIEAAGILRRLGQGASALRSAMYRGMAGGDINAPRAYWSCEDGKESTAMGSAFDGHPPMAISDDGIELAAYSDAPASDAIPTLTSGWMRGDVPGYPSSNFLRSMAFVNIPATITSEQRLMVLRTTGSAQEWEMHITSAGSLRIKAFAGDTEVLNTSFAFDILTKRGLIWIYLRQDGQDVVWQLGFAAEGADGIGFGDGTLAGHTHGVAWQVAVGSGATNNLNGMAIGHVVVLDTDEFWDSLKFARAWSRELATDRVIRLCGEEDVPLRLHSSGASRDLLGPQRIRTFLELLRSVAETDLGFFGEARDQIALFYRPRVSLYNQTAALTLDYTAAHLSPPFEPVEDDQATRNDITVTRDEGSSVRATLGTGPLSTKAPPNGVGVYDDSVTINVAYDGQLQHQAGWRLHVGTTDELRYPTVTLLLQRPVLASLAATIRALEYGDRIKISNLPSWLPPGGADLIVAGIDERLTKFEHEVKLTCTPASPWTVGVVGDTVLGKADTAGSETTASFVSGTNTSMTVATNTGPIWTTVAGQFPFDIKVGGVVLTVTAISGASPQTFTITQVPVNGINKTIPSGTALSLAHPAVVAL